MASLSKERFELSRTTAENYEQFYLQNKLSLLKDNVLISLITIVFKEILQETDNIKNPKITKFNSKFKPGISLHDYLLRLSNCFQCSQECFILALIYIDRLTENICHFIVNSYNIHRYSLFYNKKIKIFYL